MAEIIQRKKALSVSPLKSSQPVGATLAFLGMANSMPLMHGAQGCTAFAKVFFVRHFREPIPLQTTAMDHVSTVLGADENIIEALKTICEKHHPDLIGLCTTGLAEAQGADVDRMVRLFRQRYEQYSKIAVVAVPTPDFNGCLESGYALAVSAMIDQLVPGNRSGEIPSSRQNRQQINMLVGSSLTPGDIEEVKELVLSFGFSPVVFPDLSTSLDGHLESRDFIPLTSGGMGLDELNRLHEAVATIVVGESMVKAADLLKDRTGVQDYRFNSLMDLDEMDDFVQVLSDLSGREVPHFIVRQRSQLQDAMMDTHFMIGLRRIAIAADPDLLQGFSKLLKSMGGDVVAAVSPIKTSHLKALSYPERVIIGDLEDLESAAREAHAELLIGNSHVAHSASRLQLPLLRVGFPQYDWMGGYQRCWIGYKGIQQTLFELANLFMSEHVKHERSPYRSIYRTQSASGEQIQ